MLGSTDVDKAVPLPQAIGKLEGEVGPQNSLSTEYVALVLRERRWAIPIP